MRNRIYFLSDIHLGAGYVRDRRAHESRIVSMLDAFSQDASEIYMLGDILDYWFEYKTVVPRGYVRFFGKLAQLADSGIKITWLIGNHDIWLFDYLRDEIGITIVTDPIIRHFDGKKFYLAHGDDLGDLNKPGFRFVRSIFRNRTCQKLYAAIHPRWTVPFAKRWSSGSRKRNTFVYDDWGGDENEASLIFAKNYLEKVDPDINYFITGHRHLLIERQLSPTCRFIILGDCYEKFTYACWDGQSLQIKQFDGQRL